MSNRYSHDDFEEEINRKKKSTKKQNNSDRRKDQQFRKQIERGLDEYEEYEDD